MFTIIDYKAGNVRSIQNMTKKNRLISVLNRVSKKTHYFQVFGVFLQRLISAFSTYSNLPSVDAGSLPNDFLLANQVIYLPIYPGLEMKLIE